MALRSASRSQRLCTAVRRIRVALVAHRYEQANAAVTQFAGRHEVRAARSEAERAARGARAGEAQAGTEHVRAGVHPSGAADGEILDETAAAQSQHLDRREDAASSPQAVATARVDCCVVERLGGG